MINAKVGNGIRPNTFPLPTNFNWGALVPRDMDSSLLISRAKPLAASWVPRVAIKGCTLNMLTITPLKAPNIAPTVSPPATATGKP